jgi:hypothetical protein
VLLELVNPDEPEELLALLELPVVLLLAVVEELVVELVELDDELLLEVDPLEPLAVDDALELADVELVELAVLDLPPLDDAVDDEPPDEDPLQPAMSKSNVASSEDRAEIRRDAGRAIRVSPGA